MADSNANVQSEQRCEEPSPRSDLTVFAYSYKQALKKIGALSLGSSYAPLEATLWLIDIVKN